MNNTRGNALFIILIGIALFAALTYAVSSTGRVGGSFGSDDKASLGASGVLDYVRNAQTVVQQMKLDGIAAAQISYLKPTDGGFSTAPHDKKIYHPEGGGLPVLTTWEEMLQKNPSVSAGIYFILNDVGVGTTAADLMMTFFEIHPEICKKLNLKLRGSDTIPNIDTGLTAFDLFLDPLAITGITCPACVGVDMICVKDDFGTHVFYAAIQKN